MQKQAANGTVTTFVYDAQGELAAEYGGTATAAGTQYLSADALGSTRILMNGTCVIKRLNYLPLERWRRHPASAERQGITDCGVATYGGEPDLTVEFTGKERDAETGLDYFGARYFSGAQGRFTSTDPLLNSGHPANPQTWNRYSYALNSPLRYTDPTGMYVWGKCSGSEDECKAEQQRFRNSVTNLKKAASQLEAGSKERKELDKVVKKLGDEGKGNNNINFGDAGKPTASQISA